jgi:hypothetical protein
MAELISRQQELTALQGGVMGEVSQPWSICVAGSAASVDEDVRFWEAESSALGRRIAEIIAECASGGGDASLVTEWTELITRIKGVGKQVEMLNQHRHWLFTREFHLAGSHDCAGVEAVA